MGKEERGNDIEMEVWKSTEVCLGVLGFTPICMCIVKLQGSKEENPKERIVARYS